MELKISSQIQGINLDLTPFKCGSCQQFFTTTDKETKNWFCWWNTVYKPKIEPLNEDFILTAKVKNIDHQKCPEVRQCKGCFKWFLKEKVSKLQDYHWCEKCSVKEETNHA